jgi:hypothetical protein
VQQGNTQEDQEVQSAGKKIVACLENAPCMHVSPIYDFQRQEQRKMEKQPSPAESLG